MSSNNLVANTKIVTGFSPIDINGQTLGEDYVSMKNYNHCSIVLSIGVSGTTCTVTAKQATTVAGGSEKAIAFTEYYIRAASIDEFTVTTASATFNTAITTGNVYIIEIDASLLDVDGGFDCVRIDVTDPSAASLQSAIYILSEPRYAQDPANMPTSITD